MDVMTERLGKAQDREHRSQKAIQGSVSITENQTAVRRTVVKFENNTEREAGFLQTAIRLAVTCSAVASE
jgi:hypothetical protein